MENFLLNTISHLFLGGNIPTSYFFLIYFLMKKNLRALKILRLVLLIKALKVLWNKVDILEIVFFSQTISMFKQNKCFRIPSCN